MALRELKLGDLALVLLFFVFLAALLARTFFPDYFAEARARLGLSEHLVADLRLAPEWEEPLLRARLHVGDRVALYGGREAAEVLAVSPDTPAVVRLSVTAQRALGGRRSLGYYEVKPGAYLEIPFDTYVLRGRILSIE